MKREIIGLLLCACLLTSCSGAGDEAADTAAAESVTETTSEEASETTEAAAETTDITSEAETETSLNEVTMGTTPLDTAAAFLIQSPDPDQSALEEAAERPEISDYELNYAESAFVSDEQSALAEYLYANWDEEQMRSDIEKSRTQILAYDPERKLGGYDVNNQEFCADFDGDGDNELFVYRSADLDENSNWSTYRDLWYTDGEKVGMYYHGIGRAAIAGVFEARNGVPLMYIAPDILMGSTMQTAYCVSVEDGSADWYELPEDRCFMYGFTFDDDGNEKNFLFIYDTDFGYEDFRIAEMNAYDDLENFQQIGWLNGKLEILSGYGAE